MNREKTDFVSSISHEIRTPLNVMIGMCDIARHHIDERERVLDCLKKINLAGIRLTELIDDIIDIRKIEQGRIQMNLGEFNVDNLMIELKTLLESLAEDKGIVLQVFSNDVINKKVIGDYGHIMQVMINLATNSIRYNLPGGYVKLWSEEVSNTSDDVVTLRFICKDNGIGMSKEFISHIFEPFARASDTRVDKVSGIGLGMAIVKELVDVMKGSINIESEENVGTTVTVELNMKIAQDDKKISDIEEFKVEKKRRLEETKIVMVAEDMADNREVMVTFLEDLGYSAVCAGNGEEAVDLFMESEEGFYRAIFMDINMPVMDGYQATMLIRGLNRGDSNIPIIAMSANAFESDKNEAKLSGMDDYLTKPIWMGNLEEKLKSIFAI